MKAVCTDRELECPGIDAALRGRGDDTLARCFEILDGRPVRVRSHDPRLRAQTKGVAFD